jgi:two-component system sensor histidine kinase HydH
MMTAEPAWLREAPPGFGMAAEEETRMLEDAKAGSRAQRRRRRHGRRHGRRSSGEDPEDTTDELASIDESLLSEEDRAYRVARKLADRKVELSRQVFRGTLITVPLLIFVPALGAISLVYFGVVLGRRAFKLLYEPRLRERFLQEEVQRRVHTRVSDERRQLEGEHHRSLEQLSASIAHEIRNPITAAKSLVQQMGEDPNGADQVEYARVAVAELERVEKSISHLLRYAREEEMQIGEVVMEDVLESALETFRDRAERSAVAIHRQYDSSGRMRGDDEQLRRVVINLVGNAIDALEEARIQAPEIRVAMGENLAGTEVWVRIADNGMGMEDEVRGRIFDPFYTSRAAGTGLGLALCRKIVDNHGGGIEVETGPGEGTEFILTFPKRPQPGGASS